MSNFRILLTADCHIGKNQYGSFERTQDFAAVLPQIVQIAKAEAVDLVVVAGDLADAYHIGAFSSKAIRIFADDMNEAGIPMLIIEGNHEAPKLGQENRAVARIDSLTDKVFRPSMATLFTHFNGKEIRLAAADWMPATKLPDFLDSLPSDLDALILHQSCEGFLPKVGHTELKKTQLINKARVIGIGDLHISKTQTLSDGTIVISPGSTELCASDESVDKSVTIVDIGDNISTRQVSLDTRMVVKFRISEEASLTDVDSQLKALVDSNPLVFLEYSSAIRPLVELKLVEWEGLGLTLIQSDMIVEINQDDRFVAAKDSANVEMESIIAERLKDHPIEQDASIALWKSPSAAQEIIQKLESQIRQQSL